MNIMEVVIPFIIVLGILVFVHEFGHFICAKLCGVGVEKFSLGMGPKIIGKQIGKTDYMISAFPLGGFVKLTGEEPGEEIEPEDLPYSFSHKPISQKALIVAAGPLSNFLLAYLIFCIYFLSYGIPTMMAQVGKLTDNSPAQEAGFQPGDLIIQIDGQPINSWEDMSEAISSCQGNELLITINRQNDIIDIPVKPQKIESKNMFGEPIDRYVIGIVSDGKTIIRRIGIFESLWEGVYHTWRISSLTIISLGKIIQGILSPKELGGPIMIAKLAGASAKEGVSSLAFFIAIISVSLAIFNLLPIPVLDGGHLLFFAIEAIIRRPVDLVMREKAQQAGMAVLLLIMLYVSYNDVMRFFFNS